jgi:hypothetical protein
MVRSSQIPVSSSHNMRIVDDVCGLMQCVGTGIGLVAEHCVAGTIVYLNIVRLSWQSTIDRGQQDGAIVGTDWDWDWD